MSRIKRIQKWHSLEHRRYTQALILLYKSLFITGPSYIKELFSLRSSSDLRGYCKLNQPNFTTKYLHNSYRYKTSRLWNNLSTFTDLYFQIKYVCMYVCMYVCIRGASSLRIFKNLLNNVNLTTEANCCCLYVSNSLHF